MKIAKKENDIDKLFEDADFIRDEIGEPKEGSITLPITPARWDDPEPTYIPVTRLNLNNHVEYVRRIELSEMAANDKVIVTTLDGQEKLINTRYVICADYSTVAACKILSSNTFYKGRGLYLIRVKHGCILNLEDRR